MRLFPHMQTEDLTCASPKVVVRSNDHTFKQRCSWHPISLPQIIDAGIIMVLLLSFSYDLTVLSTYHELFYSHRPTDIPPSR